ncbi:hypothetical protein [Stackebrandtia nassauensis]|uniref:Uncharacterized protein n=1 Tax=Stackebrandtia nassauensis (strain DSM 44728 / CIP 108903 / NRRL B-16338 / NBRC 102104 / LLR-40K-21) TaxID=446470 RepID=D3PYS9_STANL|nr:hypothetical protein [Stackebrandtia nassauensis]ADD43512.1 hypothetical protein Snas_3856 [Stackebrandtia nassauensis DSM 44728]
MTEQIKAMLDEAARFDEPPSGINGDDVVVKGRKRNRTKRLGLAGGATLSVAAVTALALVLAPTAGGTEKGDNAAADAIEQPEFELPDLDAKPGDKFEWMPKEDGKAGPTDETREFDAAFWEYLEDNFDQVDVAPDMKKVKFEPLTDTNRTEMTREHMWVNYVDGEQVPVPVYHDEIPWYRLQANLSLDREGVADFIDVTVHPKGSFEPGPGEDYGYRNLYTCDRREAGPGGHQPAEADRDCSEKTGPDGEKIARITTEYKSGDVLGEERRVIVYRADGTAISVKDWGATRYEDGEMTGSEEPALDFEQLTELALALPDDVLVK